MIVVLAADHAGVALKDHLITALSAKRIMTLDLGTDGTTSVDYPVYAHKVCDMLRGGQFYGCVGVLICGTGIGMSMAANRHAHIRCAVATSVDAACLSRMHNDANVLALGARMLDETTALAILDVFLTTPYEGGRHALRLAKLNP